MERATQIVIELLAKGSTQKEVADITGNTESAISQCAGKYAMQIAEKKADSVVAQGGHSSRLDRLESLLASKMEGLIGVETDSMKITKMFQTVNSAVRRDAGESGGVGGNKTVINNVVQLDLPKHLLKDVNIVTNPQNDVVAVDGRDLTPASISHVNNLAGIGEEVATHEAIRQEAFDDILSAPTRQ